MGIYLSKTLAPGKFELNFRYGSGQETVAVLLPGSNFKRILVIDGWGIFCEIALIWMSLDFTDDQSTLVQVMARCRQATSHYLSQRWPRSLSPYGLTRPQWVKKQYYGFYSKEDQRTSIENYLRICSFMKIPLNLSFAMVQSSCSR